MNRRKETVESSNDVYCVYGYCIVIFKTSMTKPQQHQPLPLPSNIKISFLPRFIIDSLRQELEFRRSRCYRVRIHRPYRIQ
mmetsp:Transcript_17931/g.20565  ORF Transcript_17931/g.20565 Transcript_17931/m.20565 type:complete len:81 (+) Transcript_17931:57-299(+)